MGEKPEGDPGAQKAAPDKGKTSEAQGAGAGAGEIAVSDPGAPGTKRVQGGSSGTPEPEEAVNLNSSKSNIYRQGVPAGPPEPEAATNLNSSRSNVYRQGPPATGEPGPSPDPRTTAPGGTE